MKEDQSFSFREGKGLSGALAQSLDTRGNDSVRVRLRSVRAIGIIRPLVDSISMLHFFHPTGHCFGSIVQSIIEIAPSYPEQRW